jgi:hypothetical protein
MRHFATMFSVVVVCGCSILDPQGAGLTEQGANALAEQIGGAFGNGVASTYATAAASSANGPASFLVNIPLKQTTNCTAGGRMQVSGNISGSIDPNSGSGVLLLQVLHTITDWRCVGGLVMNGDPYLSVTGQMSFLGGAMSSAASFRFGGGVKWGTTANESLQVNLTALVNPNGSGKISGVIGGYNVVASW